MKTTNQPHDAARNFYQALLQSQVHSCWGLFSDKSQKEFIAWTLKDIYEQNPKAAETAKLGPPEVKLMFETNNLDLIMRFWRRFARHSQAVQFGRYGYYETLETTGKTAKVEVRMIFGNGQEKREVLLMLKERNGWRLGYIESGLPF